MAEQYLIVIAKGLTTQSSDVSFDQLRIQLRLTEKVITDSWQVSSGSEASPGSARQRDRGLAGFQEGLAGLPT